MTFRYGRSLSSQDVLEQSQPSSSLHSQESLSLERNEVTDMKKARIVEPHNDTTIEAFAKEMGITFQQAKFIDFLRIRFITHEHDSVKKPPEVLEVG
jgi:hypothetical protein